MSGPFKLKYKKSAFPFKTDPEKKKEISDDIGYDEEFDIFYDKGGQNRLNIYLLLPICLNNVFIIFSM